MSDTIIRVENLGKKYLLSHQQEGRSNYKALRDVMADGANLLAKSFGKRSKLESPSREEFWALKDVSFEIKQGDRVGIIGRNGAGKSTLLKILSRIVEPTEGRISIKGRVASLLEVGTGFHPELTGRENIYLNGAILGMGKAEIKRKFDEIVAFAEVEKFLDTPVKRYSSGMYVRLAFAVAAHLEPEILIVDEVLAVGDAQFQKKCLGKMEDVGKEGRTVIFVSHNMGTISSLCNKGILLSKGICVGNDRIEKIISQYSSSSSQMTGEVTDLGPLKDNQKLKIRRVRITDEAGLTQTEIISRSRAYLEITFQVLSPGRGYGIAFEIQSLQHGIIFSSTNWDQKPIESRDKRMEAGEYIARVEIPIYLMRGGEYAIKVSSTIPAVEILDIFSKEVSFDLVDLDSPIVKCGEGRNGSILPILSWNILSTTRLTSNM